MTFVLDRYDLDPEFVGSCDWCSEDCLNSQQLVDGKDGEGVMHRDCAVEKDDERIASKYPTSDENRYLTDSELDTRRERAAAQRYAS